MMNRRGFVGKILGGLAVLSGGFLFPRKLKAVVSKSCTWIGHTEEKVSWIKFIYESSPHLSAMIDLEITKHKGGSSKEYNALLEAEIVLLQNRSGEVSKELSDINGDSPKQAKIRKALHTEEGRTALANSMVEPIRGPLEYRDGLEYRGEDNLADKTQHQQKLMQLHDKGAISTRNLLEELGLDYDKEVKLMRKIQGDE